MLKALSISLILLIITGLLFGLACSGDNPLGPTGPLPEAIGWVEQESPVDNHLLSVDFVDRRHGWIAGDKGTILHTRDGGINWRIQNSGTTHRLRDIEFIDELFGWAVGEQGTLLYTKNGGRTWHYKKTDSPYQFEEVNFIDSQNGWITGRHPFVILRTTDRGQTWNNVGTGDWRWVRNLQFDDQETGLAIGDSKEIVSTTDGGATWTVNEKISTYFISDITFQDSDTGLIVSSSYTTTTYEDGTYRVGWHDLVHQTTDGGKSWNQVYKNLGNYMMFGNIFILENSNLLVVGEFAIVGSNNGGKSWSTQFYEFRKWLYASTFIDSRTGWAVGRNGTILHTTNGGVTP